MEINCVKSNQPLPKGNCLLPLSPLLDSDGLPRVGGWQRHSKLSYSRMHPVILHAKHPVTRLVILSESMSQSNNKSCMQYKLFAEILPGWNPGQQQDAHEFMVGVLDNMEISNPRLTLHNYSFIVKI